MTFFEVLFFDFFLEGSLDRIFEENGGLTPAGYGFQGVWRGIKGEVNSPFRDFRDSRIKDGRDFRMKGRKDDGMEVILGLLIADWFDGSKRLMAQRAAGFRLPVSLSTL